MRQTINFQPQRDLPILTYLAIGWAFVAVIVQVFVAQRSLLSGRKKIAAGTWKSPPRSTLANDLDDQERRLCELLQTRMIISLAILEGATFLLLIAYLVEGQWLCLAMAFLILLRMLSLFPTRSNVERWITEQQELIAADTQA